MQLVDLFQLMSGIVYLKEQPILRTHVDSFYLRALLERIWVVIEILEVKHSEHCVSCMVI